MATQRYTVKDGSIRTFFKPQYDSVYVNRGNESDYILEGDEFSIDLEQLPEILSYDHRGVSFVIAKVYRTSRKFVALLKLDELSKDIQSHFQNY